MFDLEEFKKDKHKYYKSFYKKKSNGKARHIQYAIEPLLSEQYKLKDKLDNIYLPPSNTYGFIKGRGVKEAVLPHIKKNCIITFDIKNFFPSIKEKHLLSLGLSEYDASIATLDGKLVQGTCIAPVLSNMYMKEFDTIMGIIADTNDWNYSRYVDDICISADVYNIYGKARSIIEGLLSILGLKLNHDKTKVMHKSDQQIVLGVVLNDIPSIHSCKRKELRAKIYNKNINESDIGYINYINSINPKQASRLIGGIVN